MKRFSLTHEALVSVWTLDHPPPKEFKNIWALRVYQTVKLSCVWLVTSRSTFSYIPRQSIRQYIFRANDIYIILKPKQPLYIYNIEHYGIYTRPLTVQSIIFEGEKSRVSRYFLRPKRDLLRKMQHWAIQLGCREHGHELSIYNGGNAD